MQPSLPCREAAPAGGGLAMRGGGQGGQPPRSGHLHQQLFGDLLLAVGTSRAPTPPCWYDPLQRRLPVGGAEGNLPKEGGPMQGGNVGPPSCGSFGRGADVGFVHLHGALMNALRAKMSTISRSKKPCDALRASQGGPAPQGQLLAGASAQRPQRFQPAQARVEVPQLRGGDVQTVVAGAIKRSCASQSANAPKGPFSLDSLIFP